ncbi:MAG: TIGR04283 family arsenosugar biosynthesis glycosyltransferase [Gammaproteobacteria bacterium]|nr:TIGR04283 family arsenosugar biosynthesis glycosyltransferase [Gammaproteobacteria bacterium]
MIISIIIPTLNESASISRTLIALQAWRQRGHEVILVDAGSGDDTVILAHPLVDQVLCTGRGRSQQMNIGAEHANGEVLLFLHADTLIAETADHIILNSLSNGCGWGRFNVEFTSARFIFKIIATLMNLRSCLSSIATGDQAIFVKKSLFEEVGRYPLQPLMEDIELSIRLKRISRACCQTERVMTSSRRWENNGVLNTIGLMWSLRLAYFLGVSPARLKRWYKY